MAQITKTFTVDSVYLTSKWKWSEGSAGNYSISSGPSGASTTRDFNLSEIPANAEIVSAILTFSASRNSYDYGGFPSQPAITHAYTIGGKNGSGAGSKSFDLTASITPNSVNTINFYYKPSLSTSSYSSDSSISDTSCSTQYAFKNIVLTVIYETSNIFYGDSTWKKCEVYYGNNNEWKPCTVYFGDDSTWKQV